MPIEEEQRSQGLVLRRRAHVLRHRKMREERVDLPFTHLSRVAYVVEVDEAPHPRAVCPFGTKAVVTGAECLAHLIEQLWWPVHRRYDRTSGASRKSNLGLTLRVASPPAPGWYG